MKTGLLFSETICQSLEITRFLYGLLSLTELTTGVGPKHILKDNSPHVG